MRELLKVDGQLYELVAVIEDGKVVNVCRGGSNQWGKQRVNITLSQVIWASVLVSMLLPYLYLAGVMWGRAL